MKVNEPEIWAAQLQEFNADETSQKFRDFLVFWIDTAEKLIDDSGVPVRDALATAFAAVESELGFLSMEWIGQMLFVAIQHWVHGPQAWEEMSIWERRMIEQAWAVKAAELTDLAADTPAQD